MKQKLRHEIPLTNRAQEIKNQRQEGPNQAQEVQKGRSMVEMLGVLAIIGVLSIGGIVGYTQAMNRYKANEIVDTASKLCVIAKTNDAQGRNETVTLSDLDITGSVAGCATQIETTYNREGEAACRTYVSGCNNEKGLLRAIYSVNGFAAFENGRLFFPMSDFDDNPFWSPTP